MSLDLGEEESPPAEEGSPAWMATFGDMMSLLLTFFILILSFANMDVIKFSAAVGSLRDAFGTKQLDPGQMQSLAASLVELSDAESRPDLRVVDLPFQASQQEADLLRRLELTIAAHELEKLVEAERTPRGVVVRVEGQHLFDPGSARLRPEGLLILDEIARLLKEVTNEVSIEGHTDDTPIATPEFPSNWHLSAGRAISALEYLVAANGVEARRLSAAGFSHMRPLVPNASPDQRDRNRRVEFVFLRPLPEEREAAGGGGAAEG